MDYLQDTVVDTIRPFRDSPIEVRRRWFRVPEGTPLLGFPSAFLSAHYEPYPWFPRDVGEVYPSQAEVVRPIEIDGFDYTHLCGDREDFQLGAAFDPTRNVVYDDEWIPECCEREAMCVTQLCGQDQVNARPAAQLWSYPIPHQDADEFTPVLLQQAALNQGDQSPSWPGYLWSWFAGGDALDSAWQKQLLADDAAQLQEVSETARFAPDNAITQAQTAAGWQMTVEQGAVSGTLTAAIVGGQLELCGTNATICPALMPAGWEPWEHDVLTAVGTDQAGAVPITTPSVAVFVGSTDGGGLRLPAAGEAPTLINVLNVSATKTYKVYPATGDAWIPGFVANAPIDLAPETQLFIRRVATNQWMVESTVRTVTVPPPPPPTTGTVTAVDATTSSAGLSIVVTDPTTTPLITIDLAPELDLLLPVPLLNGVLVCDGAGNFSVLGIGDWLSFSGGDLDVVPPTATKVSTVCVQFTITGATGVFQATGNTIAIPAAGEYLLTAQVRGIVTPGVAGAHTISAKLRDVTSGADVTGAVVMVVSSDLNANPARGTATIVVPFTAPGAVTVELYAARSGTTWTTSRIDSDATGRTVLTAVRLS